MGSISLYNTLLSSVNLIQVIFFCVVPHYPLVILWHMWSVSVMFGSLPDFALLIFSKMNHSTHKASQATM